MADKSSIERTDATWRRSCTRCQQSLPREAFFIDRSRHDGLSYVCRQCKNTAARERYTPKADQAHGWLKPARDGDKRQARRRVNYLVEQGHIPHPENLPCFDCGDEVFTQLYRHEYDHAKGYNGEHQLYVEPVCSKCHHNREDARCGR